MTEPTPLLTYSQDPINIAFHFLAPRPIKVRMGRTWPRTGPTFCADLTIMYVLFSYIWFIWQDTKKILWLVGRAVLPSFVVKWVRPWSNGKHSQGREIYILFVVHSNAPEWSLVSAHSNLTTAKQRKKYYPFFDWEGNSQLKKVRPLRCFIYLVRYFKEILSLLYHWLLLSPPHT